MAPHAHRLACAEGRAVRAAYAAALPGVVRRPVRAPRALECRVFSYSSLADLPEQVVSIRSFLQHVGRPTRYTVVSDGSHDAGARALLRAIDRAVDVADLADVARRDLPAPVRGYARTHPMGAKLALELSLPVEGATLYADADVLFLPGAGGDLTARIARDGGVPGWFLVDEEWAYLDRRLGAEGDAPVNAGMFLLHRPLDWDEALDRLERHAGGDYGFHTEQTVVHIAMHASGARGLDPRRYVIATDDMHALRDRHAGPDVVLRHYTTPVRHKLWCTLARLGRLRRRAQGHSSPG